MAYRMNCADQLWRSSIPSPPSGFCPGIAAKMDAAGSALGTALVFLVSLILSPIVGVVTLFFWLYRALLVSLSGCAMCMYVCVV